MILGFPSLLSNVVYLCAMALRLLAVPGLACLALPCLGLHNIKCYWYADYFMHEGGHQQSCGNQVLCSVPAGRQLYSGRRGATRDVA